MADAPTQRQARLARVMWVLTFVVIVVVTGVLVLWALPSLLAPSEEGMTAAQHLMAVNDARGTLVTFALGGWCGRDLVLHWPDILADTGDPSYRALHKGGKPDRR
jgi:hypothetical protein